MASEQWQNMRLEFRGNARTELIWRMKRMLVKEHIKSKDKGKYMKKFRKNRKHIENVLQVLDEGVAKSRTGAVHKLKNALARLPQIAVDDGIDNATEGTKLEMLVLMEKGLWESRY